MTSQLFLSITQLYHFCALLKCMCAFDGECECEKGFFFLEMFCSTLWEVAQGIFAHAA